MYVTDAQSAAKTTPKDFKLQVQYSCLVIFSRGVVYFITIITYRIRLGTMYNKVWQIMHQKPQNTIYNYSMDSKLFDQTTLNNHYAFFLKSITGV